MQYRISLKTILLYTLYAVCCLCLNEAVGKIPLSLGLCFAMLICGTNVFTTPLIFTLCSLVNLDIKYVIICLFGACFLAIVTFIYRRAHKYIKLESAVYMIVALAPYVAFCDWQGIDDIYFTRNEFIIKGVASVAVMLFTYFSFKAVYTLLYRVYRCKPKVDEIICTAIFYCVVAIGFINAVGEYVALCVALCLTLLSVRLTKNANAVVITCILSLPLAIANLSLTYVTAFMLLSVLLLIFVNTARLTPSAICLAISFAFFYLNGYYYSVNSGIVRGLLLFFACLIPVIPTDETLQEKWNLLCVRSVVAKTYESQFRARTGDKLYKISDVFREVENAFLSIDETIDESSLKERINSELKERLCKGCDKAQKCKLTTVYSGFKRLTDRGAMKGKVSLVDLSADVTQNCVKTADVLSTMNVLLADYRRLTIEAENAKSGRLLLANQAKGVAEVIKSCAVEISSPQECNENIEKKLLQKLAQRGISCPELKYFGGREDALLVTTIGKVKSGDILSVIENELNERFILKDKTVYDGEKTCFTFALQPPYDAAFGVAYAIKEGENTSGDTHSVIKINEHCFLMCLSDGMGSGEYAEKVSRTAISLIEAFYRAEMPTDTVLDTINKLICFNKEERFACIDVAEIDLNTLTASFIKIGSPVGMIVREGEIKILESHSLPLGILDGLKPTVCKEQLKNDDIVVFMSDGITSSFDGAMGLYEFLQTLTPLNPQSLADKILAKALSLTGKANDDMTVLCTRIFSRS